MAFPVMDRDYKLVGIVTYTNIRQALKSGKSMYCVKDIKTTKLIKVFPDDTLNEALMKIGDRKINYLPVADPTDERRLLGFLSTGDIIIAYKKKRIEDMYSENHVSRVKE